MRADLCSARASASPVRRYRRHETFRDHTHQSWHLRPVLPARREISSGESRAAFGRGAPGYRSAPPDSRAEGARLTALSGKQPMTIARRSPRDLAADRDAVEAVAAGVSAAE